jgi:hypothetical protein
VGIASSIILLPMKLQTAGEYGRNDTMEGQQEESSAACVSRNWETIKKDLSAGVDQKAHQVPLLAVTRKLTHWCSVPRWLPWV